MPLAGTYDVALTVTDNRGGTDIATASVTVAAATVFAQDDFGRNVANGWGAADVGGTWSLGGPATRWSVSGGQGRVSLNPGNGYTAYLPSVSSATTEVAATLTTDKVPTGGGQYVSVLGRRVSATADYRAKIRMAANGQVAVWVTRNQGATETVLTSATLAGVSYAAGDQLEGATPGDRRLADHPAREDLEVHRDRADGVEPRRRRTARQGCSLPGRWACTPT